MVTPWARYKGRQLLGRLMHGDDVLVGVPATKLTTTTMGVTRLSIFDDDYFNDWYGRFFLGPLADNDFVIDDFDQLVEPALTDGLITFKPTMSSAVTTQDQFEAYPDFSPAEMNDAINLAIASVEEECLQDKRDETITVVSSTTYEYDLPAGFSYIQSIVMEQGTSGRFSTSLDTIDRRYWRILRGSPPKLWFDSNYVSLTAGRKLRILGQQGPAQLTKDGDLCLVDQAYVIYQAKANLHLSRISELGDEHDKKMVVAQSRAHEERRGVMVAGVGEKVSL